jgi:hypothetical protein
MSDLPDPRRRDGRRCPLTAQQLTDRQKALTESPSADLVNKCGGVNHGDQIARDYITAVTTER